MTNIFDKELSQEAKNMITKLKNQAKKSTIKGSALRELKIWNLILGTICFLKKISNLFITKTFR